MQKKPPKPPIDVADKRIQWIPFELEALKEPAFGRHVPSGHVRSLRSLPDANFSTGIPAS